MDDNAALAVPFFITFMMINSFMLEQLFVGVLVDHFAQSSGHALMTAQQKNWRYVQMCLYRFQSKEKVPPTIGWRCRCFEIVNEQKFKRFILFCILSNVVGLVVGSSAFPIFDSPTFDYVNDLCVVVYTVEFLLKLSAYGWTTYFNENKLDFVVFVTIWITSVHAHLEHNFGVKWFTWIQAFQAVRVLRIFDVVSSSERFVKLVQTVTLSLPHVANLMTLMTLNFFVFGVAAMKLFGNIPLDDNKLLVLDDLNNFGDIVSSMQLLVQMTTGMTLPPLIIDCQRYRGGTVLPFLFVFYLISNFLFLNLFIALVLENFEYNWSDDFAITDDAFEELKEFWIAEGLKVQENLNVRRLKTFVLKLEGQLSISASFDKFWYNRLLLELGIDVEQEHAGHVEIQFHELLLALSKLRFGDDCLPFEKEIEADMKKQRRREAMAHSILKAFINAWRMSKSPPSYIQTAEELRRYRAA
eukprot:SAG11_NODE_6035_length_1405_cov_1.515314_1_plen_468_part_11